MLFREKAVSIGSYGHYGRGSRKTALSFEIVLEHGVLSESRSSRTLESIRTNVEQMDPGALQKLPFFWNPWGMC